MLLDTPTCTWTFQAKAWNNSRSFLTRALIIVSLGTSGVSLELKTSEPWGVWSAMDPSSFPNGCIIDEFYGCEFHLLRFRVVVAIKNHLNFSFPLQAQFGVRFPLKRGNFQFYTFDGFIPMRRFMACFPKSSFILIELPFQIGVTRLMQRSFSSSFLRGTIWWIQLINSFMYGFELKVESPLKFYRHSIHF